LEVVLFETLKLNVIVMYMVPEKHYIESHNSRVLSTIDLKPEINSI